MRNILAASLGILAVSWLPMLPPLSALPWLTVGFFLLITLLLFRRATRWLACLLAGALWAIVAAHWMLMRHLPVELEGHEILVTGAINSLPDQRQGYERFGFRVHEFHNVHPDYARSSQLPQQLALSWYGQTGLRVGQQWTLKVKLSRPRGFVNRGGFDYQRWLISRGFHATGYVRPSTLNHLHNEQLRFPVEESREAVRDWLDTRFDAQTAPLLRALAVGDTSGIDPLQWSDFRRTGTIHLMAISGLHIGFVAVMAFGAGVVARAGLSVLLPRLAYLYWLPGIMSCTAAAFYAALAGFSLPTQRSLIMVLILNLGLLLGRPGTGFRSLSWAVLAVLALDPLAGYDLGFWLSFGAVGCLLYSFQHRRMYAATNGYWRRCWGWIAPTARAQWIVFVGLMLPMVVLNQPVSLISPVANLIAVPAVSFFAVAPLLPGILLHYLGIGAGEWLVELASLTLSLFIKLVAELARNPWLGDWFPAGGRPNPAGFIGAALGALLLLSPKGVPQRWLGLFLLLPVLLPPKPTVPPLALTVLDVGQGLAVVVATKNKVLVYDTGPAYSERFNAGEAIVAPHLRARGLNRIDRLLVSHSHDDHAGGLLPLLAQVEVVELMSGEPLLQLDPGRTRQAATADCRKGAQWQWDEVSFALIDVPRPESGANDQSCVLLVTYAGQTILIPGDIEAPVEQALLEQELLPSRLTVLLAAHHGSRSSSTERFVDHTRPEHVVYSAGYRSSYGHPHPLVVARFEAVGSRTHRVAESGELNFIWNDAGELTIERWRERHRRYWFDLL